ncbi:MAG: DUF2927 domain-containing protein [Bacteroidota bacterium]
MNHLKVLRIACYGIFLLSLTHTNCGVDEDLADGSCQTLADSIALTEREALFFDLTINEEPRGDVSRLRKWNGQINLFLEGVLSQDQFNEVNDVVTEINSLSSFIEIVLVDNVESSNLRFFFGTREDYIALFGPNVPVIPDGNNGLVNIARDSSFEIKEASIWIDNVNFPDFEFQQHFIREQIARSLGLVNDITSFDDSIFHETINTNISYSELDQEMIALMLGGVLRPGFCPNTILKAIEE